MKTKAVIVLALAVTGCMSGPRPFDGVLGYQTSSVPDGTQVTYIDEAGVKREKTIKRISKVCAAGLGADIAHVKLKVLSEAIYEQQVSMSVSIPVGLQSTGSFGSRSPGSPASAIQNASIQNEEVMRGIKLKKIIALCARSVD